MIAPRQVFDAYHPRVATPRPTWRHCPGCGDRLPDGSEGQACRRAGCSGQLFHNPAPAVSVLVTDETRVLLCRRSVHSQVGAGAWCLPCGYVDFDEDFLTAARREVREETGLEVEIRSILSVVSNFLSPGVHSIVTVLLARPAGGSDPVAGDDADAAAWWPAGGPHPALAFAADDHILRRYFADREAGARVEAAFASAGSFG